MAQPTIQEATEALAAFRAQHGRLLDRADPAYDHETDQCYLRAFVALASRRDPQAAAAALAAARARVKTITRPARANSARPRPSAAKGTRAKPTS